MLASNEQPKERRAATVHDAVVALAVTAKCERCGNAYAPRRSDSRYCSTRCRVATHRAKSDDYVLTDEDRAAIARVMSVPTEGVPGLGPPLSPERQRELAMRVRAPRVAPLGDTTADLGDMP